MRGANVLLASRPHQQQRQPCVRVSCWPGLQPVHGRQLDGGHPRADVHHHVLSAILLHTGGARHGPEWPELHRHRAGGCGCIMGPWLHGAREPCATGAWHYPEFIPPLSLPPPPPSIPLCPLQVTIINVNHPPVLLGLQTLSVDENAPPPVLAGSLSAFDPDGDALTFSLAVLSPMFTLVSHRRRASTGVLDVRLCLACGHEGTSISPA